MKVLWGKVATICHPIAHEALVVVGKGLRNVFEVLDDLSLLLEVAMFSFVSHAPHPAQWSTSA